MKDVKKVDIILENTDYFSVPADKLLEFSIEDIKEKITRIGCNMIGKIRSSEKIIMLIDRTANYVSEISKEKYFERIKEYNDITSIEVFYSDGTSEVIFATWSDEDEYKNSFQETYIDKDLYITIGENVKLNEVFKEYFKDETLIDFSREMTLEGDEENEDKEKD